MTTKIHALSDQWCSPVLVLLSPGQAGDNPMLAPLIETYVSQDGHRFRLLADKAYSHPSTRIRLRGLRIPHTIPERRDQIAHRKAKGSRGGRPPAFNPSTYAHRNTVERSFNRLKHWRGTNRRGWRRLANLDRALMRPLAVDQQFANLPGHHEGDAGGEDRGEGLVQLKRVHQ